MKILNETDWRIIYFALSYYEENCPEDIDKDPPMGTDWDEYYAQILQTRLAVLNLITDD